jgi:hypothetical protein
MAKPLFADPGLAPSLDVVVNGEADGKRLA